MAVVISPEGRRAIRRQGYPFAPTTGYQYGGSLLTQSVLLSGALRASYGYIYRSQPWVYIVINKLATSIANLPLHTFTEDPNGERLRVRPDPSSAQGRLPELLRKPTPTMSAFDWKYALVTEYLTYGNFLGVKVGGGGLPREVWPVPWYCVEVVEGVSKPIDGYRISLGGKVYPFLPGEVVHLQSWKGISPLEPLRRTLGIEDAALREIAAAFENSMRIQGILQAPETQKKLTKADTDLIRSEFESAYGGVDNAYRAAVIGGGLEWKPLQFSHTEAELIPIRKLAREEVAAALDVPPPMVGILDHGTYSNYEMAQRSYYQDSIGPRLVKIEEGLEVQLVEPEPEWAALDLEFNMDEVLKASLADRAEAYTKLTRVGFSLNQILHIENAPEVNEPLYNTAWVPQELMPAAADALDIWQTSRQNMVAALGNPDVPGSENMTLAELVAAIQKIYLGVGVLISPEEARDILNRGGAGLPAKLPPGLETSHVKPAPPPPPQALTIHVPPVEVDVPEQVPLDFTPVVEAIAQTERNRAASERRMADRITKALAEQKAPEVTVTVPARKAQRVVRDEQGLIVGVEDADEDA